MDRPSYPLSTLEAPRATWHNERAVPEDLAAKTHRGIRGRVEKGKFGGGLCYGYDVVKHTDAEGEPIRGERTVNEAQAEIVRRVFRTFASGISPRAIARRLNDEGIPGPDGALWTDSTLRGHAAPRLWGMSRAVLKFAERALLVESYAAWSI